MGSVGGQSLARERRRSGGSDAVMDSLAMGGGCWLLGALYWVLGAGYSVLGAGCWGRWDGDGLINGVAVWDGKDARAEWVRDDTMNSVWYGDVPIFTPCRPFRPISDVPMTKDKEALHYRSAPECL